MCLPSLVRRQSEYRKNSLPIKQDGRGKGNPLKYRRHYLQYKRAR